jgi:hypothetical protein
MGSSKLYKYSEYSLQSNSDGEHMFRRGIILYLYSRVPECLSLRPNWLPEHPLPPASVSPLEKRGEETLACVLGVGGSQFGLEILCDMYVRLSTVCHFSTPFLPSVNLDPRRVLYPLSDPFYIFPSLPLPGHLPWRGRDYVTDREKGGRKNECR